MLALVTYKFIYHFYGKIVLYRIRRGLLFYYCYTGVCRYLQGDNRQQARVFLCPFISIRGGVVLSFVKLVVGFLNTILLTINF